MQERAQVEKNLTENFLCSIQVLNTQGRLKVGKGERLPLPFSEKEYCLLVRRYRSIGSDLPLQS